MSYPEGDTSFHEVKIVKVDEKGGWIEGSDGFSFGLPDECHIAPKVGMTARFYGKGIGYSVRGLFLDGEQVYYHSEKENKEYRETQLYGKDAAEWLARWDSGDSVWSVEMGGLGPGYEQAIQIIAAEILRVLLDKKYDCSLWEDKVVWKLNREEFEAIVNPIIEPLGCSGAQFGAAINIATVIYRNGPVKALTMPKIQKRLIQVSKNFPSLS